MAHMIEFNESKKTHSFVSHGEKAWHGLGKIVDNAMTAAQCIEYANMDYEVALHPNYTCLDGEYLLKEGEFSTVRMDTKEPLGTVKARYEIVQNRDAFGFFDSIVEAGEAIFETAGVLGKGERIFVTAKLPEDFLVKGEPCNKYLILTNSHDGSSSIIAGFTAVRIVCNNTLQAALRGLTNKICIEHRAGAQERLQEAYKVMQIASKYMDDVNQIFNQMAETRIQDDQLRNYIMDVMKPVYKNKEEEEKISTRFQNQVNSIYEFALSHPTQQTEAAKGTVWGAYNSISGYFTHICKFKNEEQRFNSQMFGNANNKILKGFQKAAELTHII